MAARGGARNVFRRQLPNRVPSIFVESIEGSEPQDLALRDCSNNLWHLKIEKFHDGWYFTDGWVKFVEDNMIERGDVLFYQSSCKGVLDFKVLSPSRCEDDEVECLEEVRTTKPQDVKTEVKIEAADDIDNIPSIKWEVGEPAGGSVLGKRKKKQDFYGAEIFKSGRARPPTNPYFVADVREKRVNEMYIPADVVKSYKLQLPETMLLVDSVGRKFETKRTSWKDGRVNYHGGWKALCRSNLAGIGDKLICEFVQGGGGSREREDLHLKMAARGGARNIFRRQLPNSYKLQLPEMMLLVDSVGRKFETKRTSWKDGWADRIWRE
ncbi:B3 domain-containing protein At5g25475-like isoform X2 [Salvia miltiorrhiza]|uniref:B3 domain-containing protein At5g25475-like isoform X2 n=1 Tax=Salvia miltiorrhiza TaxID=226208 RepID=UPI0025ABB10C|nr:B3 domain-containing protein At5g25475-like isoform X2 [Salvia miltiorrhiza]